MKRYARELALGVRFAGIAAIFVLSFACVALPAKAKFNKVLSIGSPAPAWADLPGVDDKKHGLDDLKDANAVVVVFTCNHCPFAKLYEDRLLEFAKKYREQKVEVVAISVNKNPADGLEKMKERATAKEYPFPYLYDESQETGRAFGATVTPHFFLLDGQRKIAYMGAFDDNADIDKVQKRFLVNAVDAVLAGKEPPVKESLQRGCEIPYE